MFIFICDIANQWYTCNFNRILIWEGLLLPYFAPCPQYVGYFYRPCLTSLITMSCLSRQMVIILMYFMVSLVTWSLGFGSSVLFIALYSFAFLVLLWGCVGCIFEFNCCGGMVFLSKYRLSIPLVERWMGRSTTINNDKELEVWDWSRLWICIHHISWKFREENEAGLMFWTGPGLALEILRLWEYSDGKSVKIFVILKYICTLLLS